MKLVKMSEYYPETGEGFSYEVDKSAAFRRLADHKEYLGAANQYMMSKGGISYTWSGKLSFRIDMEDEVTHE